MSLVGSQVYANSSKSCWVSVNGGDTVNGNLTVTGNLQVDGATQVSSLTATSNVQALGVTSTTTIQSTAGDVVAAGSLKGQQVVFTAPLGTPIGASVAANGVSPATVTITAGAQVNFQSAAGVPDTTLVLGAPGSKTDVLSTNFLNAIGPIPANLVSPSAPQTVTLSPPANARGGFFTAVGYPVVVNGEYDVQIIGNLIWDGTGVAPGATDEVRVNVNAGTADQSVLINYYYPGFAGPIAWGANFPVPVYLRGRLLADGTSATLLVRLEGDFANAAVGNIVGTITFMDIVRVA